MTQNGLSPYFDIKTDPQGRRYMEVFLDGIALLRLVLTNKGTAFSHEERLDLKLDSLLPPQTNTLEQQVARVAAGYFEMPSPLAKYQYLRALQERQEILFYALLKQNLEEMLPIVYTPTVGEAVEKFGALYQNPRGISLSPLNIDRADKTLTCFPMNDVRMIVATDASAILGIGDQGYGGLAIAIGKLALYTVGGGVSPFHSAPVMLDVGTERLDLINDPNYLGVRQRRLQGEAYLEFVEQFVQAVKKRWPKAVIQWEDLAKDTAFAVLERFQGEVASFNDDIQGTGAVALAGVMSALELKHERGRDQVFVIHGAGAGGIGVALAIREGLMEAGLSETEATERILVLDSKGLLLSDRPMESYKKTFAQDPARIEGWDFAGAAPNLLETIQNGKATVLLGLSGRAGAFDEEVVKATLANTERPIIFPLSNPTSSSEAKPEDIIRWTHGKAIIATGSPFDDVEHDGITHSIGQGNNAFIFPGLGFGSVLSGASKITGGMVLEAARALADYVAETYLPHGLIYPPVSDLEETSIRVAARVALRAVADGVAREPVPEEKTQSWVRKKFWRPEYLPFVRGTRQE